MESLAELKKQEKTFKILMVGGGYAEEELKALTGSLGLNQDVMFLGTITDRDRLKRIFCRADLFVFPSIYDTSSIVLREAAAVACPALLIKGANATEGVTDKENGYLSENDSTAIAACIMSASADRTAMRETGKHAQQTIYTRWDEIMEGVNERYVDIVKTGLRRNKLILKLVSPSNLKGVCVQQHKKKMLLLQKKL